MQGRSKFTDDQMTNHRPIGQYYAPGVVLSHCSECMWPNPYITWGRGMLKITRLTFLSHVHDVYVLKPCITRTSTWQVRNANTHCGTQHSKHMDNLGRCQIRPCLQFLLTFDCFRHACLPATLHWVDHRIVVQIKLSSRKAVCCGQVA